MLKKILAVLAMLYAAAAFAAVDVNKATAADLDGIKGIGPVMSKRILDERKKHKFKSWEDLVTRVKGLGENSAAKLSAEGLTVNGEEFKAAAAAKKEAKADAKAAKKEAKAGATPATPATPAKPATATTAATPAKPATPATPPASAKK